MAQFDVVIVGAGLAGLTCAAELVRKGAAPLIVEAGDRVGGRVCTDKVDGFLLDRGFQVLLTAYPETRRALDYDALHLGAFRSGALVWLGGRFHKVADPLRNLGDALPTVFSPVGSLADKLRIAALRSHAIGGSLEELLQRPETSTLTALQNRGFSPQMIHDFFRPFLGGIFLETGLVTSSRKFEFVFRMFSEGDAALPAGGMQAIPAQLAAKLPSGSIRTGTPVSDIGAGRVTTRFGETIEARHIVVAAEETTAARLLGTAAPFDWSSAVCLYYDAPESPVKGSWLVLNGDSAGPINNLCVPTDVCPAYGPQNRALVSVTVIGIPAMNDSQLETHVRGQLLQWYGRQTGNWRHLRTYRIDYALPLQKAGALEPAAKPARVAPGLYRCGDYADVASINGAMASGRRAAEAVLSYA